MKLQNCQEYLRTLCASVAPSSLPTPTSIVVIGCGSPTLIPMYIEQTAYPYAIYADPTRRLHDIFGMTRTLSLGKKDPDYIQYTLVAGMVRSIVQGVKRIGSGDALQAGDMQQVGGEFLFSSSGRLDEKKSKIEVIWCHRMKDTRDHDEVPILRKVLGLDLSDENTRSRPQRRWTTANLARTLSNRRSSWIGRSSSRCHTKHKRKQGAKIKKRDEVGMFQFGGSSIVVAFEKGRIEFDKDLVSISNRAIGRAMDR